MTTIYSQLCGIGIVTAYLIDIFESSINPLTLVLVSSKQRRTDDLTLHISFFQISSFTVVIGSCLQMFAADLLGRWTTRCHDEVSPFNKIDSAPYMLWTFFRKVFLVLCATGMGIGATIFSGIFWVTSHTDSWIFGSENFDELLSNNILVVFTLVFFVGSFQFGFGPMRYTLLGELFEPREQVVELFSWTKFRSSLFSGDNRKSRPLHLLGSGLRGDQVIPPSRGQVRAHNDLRRRRRSLCVQRSFHNCRDSRDQGEGEGFG